MMAPKIAQNKQENNKIKNLEGTTDEILDGNFCIDQLGGGVLDFDGFDIDWSLGCLDSDEKNNKKMNLDGTEENLSVNGVGVDDNLDETGTLTAEGLVEGFCFDDLCGGDLNSDIDWLMGYLDSDQQEESVEESAIEKLGRREDQEFDEFGGGLDDIGVFDIDWFMRCLDSEEPIESSTANKRKDEAEFGWGDDLGGGDLCSDDLGNFDVDWLMQCLNSNLEEEELVENSTTNKPEKEKHEDESGGGLCFDILGDFDVDWFMLLLDSNQEEEPVGHSTISKLRKRKFQGEENSCPTKKMRL